MVSPDLQLDFADLKSEIYPLILILSMRVAQCSVVGWETLLCIYSG